MNVGTLPSSANDVFGNVVLYEPISDEVCGYAQVLGDFLYG